MTGFLQSLLDSLSFGSLFGLTALGIALVFGVMRMINFAHGELIMVAAYSVFVLRGLPLPVTLFLSLGVAVLVALLLERAAFRPVRNAHPTTLLVTSFVASYLLQNVVMAVAGARPKGVDVSPELLEVISLGNLRVSTIDLVTIVTSAVLIMLLWLLLSRTLIGVQMRAAADDFLMARLLGVRANRVIAAAFAASGLLAGCVSLLLVARSGSISPTMGLTPVLVGFVAAVIGGVGSLVGALVGGYLLGLATVLLQTYLPSGVVGYRDGLVFGFVILILLLRPQGLLASSAERTRV
ncbi:MAG: branched-chain amino acid ABC transporter permease [Thermoleophilia bacterium]|nr:branched-chain amino acid ABC transporter permease [Thermoleophilia bacterium]